MIYNSTFTDKELRTIQNLMGKIAKHVKDKKWSCFVNGCTKEAINSHLLMQNGILNYVAENGRLVELRTKKPEAFKKNELPFSFKEVGIKQAISFPLFCDMHDTALFKEIEDGHVDYQKYRHLVLYCYRSICAEIRRKEIIVEQLSREIKSHELSAFLSPTIQYEKRISKEGQIRGIEDLEYYKSQFLLDINNGTKNYSFFSLSIPIKGVYASTISTLFSTGEEAMYDNILNIFIFHLIPKYNSSQLVMGYHNNHVNDRILDYIDRWNNVKDDKIGYMLTGLLGQVETWGMSPSVYKQISTEQIQKFYKLLEDNVTTSDQYPIERMNLFEGIL